MHAADTPSPAAWVALAALVVVVEGDYLWERRRGENQSPFERRYPRFRLIAPTAGAAWLGLLAALDRTLSEVMWWSLAGITGGSALYMTWMAPVVLCRRRASIRTELMSADRKLRNAGYLVLGLIAASVGAMVAGMILITVLTADFQLALAASLAAGFVLRSAWRLIVRRRFRPAGQPSA